MDLESCLCYVERELFCAHISLFDIEYSRKKKEKNVQLKSETKILSNRQKTQAIIEEPISKPTVRLYFQESHMLQSSLKLSTALLHIIFTFQNDEFS